ncbi:MAG: YggS family pyridoxal phosphate-dependent enzyme [Traorella sp.]
MIQENIIRIKKTLPENVKLIAVSKTYPRSAIDEALLAHQVDFGENRVQELCDKYRKNDDVIWHMIGHLQTNKVKYIIDKVALIHSVDSLHLLEVIEKEAKKINRVVHVLLQVNLTHEESKFGFDENELEDVLHVPFKYVCIDGMMVIGPTTHDLDEIEKVFIQAEKLKEKYHFQELSMGMSYDYQLAIKHQATMVRIGSEIFGKRK